MEKGGKKLNDVQLLTNKPLISVITVVYNAEDILEQTILSVLNQSYKHIEYIIIDGGSTDQSIQIIKKYDSQLNYWISEPDNGIYDAMNKGTDAATGNWVYFLGAGDTLLQSIDIIVGSLNDANYIYYGDVYRTDLLKLYDGKYSSFKLAVSNICQQAIFYPLSALKKYKFNTKYKSLADHNLNMQLYGDKNYHFKYLPVVIGVYDGEGFSEVNLDYPFYSDKLKIIRANFPLVVFLYTYIRTFLAKRLKPNYLKV
jgi:glycosyltransferase involved in cell wall biosynthesis